MEYPQFRQGALLGISENYTIEFPSTFPPEAGTAFYVEISGTFPHFNTSNPEKIVDVVQWGPGQWLSTSHMFDGAVNLGPVLSATDFPVLNSSTDASYMFHNCSTLSSFGASLGVFDFPYVGDWNFSAVQNTSHMFEGCASLTTLGSGAYLWNFNNVIHASYMFNDCASLTLLSPGIGDSVSGWGFGNASSVNYMFAATPVFVGQAGMESWFASGTVHNMEGMFIGSGFNGDVGSWNVISVSNFSKMFEDAEFFQGSGIWNWQMSTYGSLNLPGQINASQMFRRATSFDADLGNWDVTNIGNASYMFSGASAFQGAGLSFWRLPGLVDASYMFSGASSFNANLKPWNESLAGGEQIPVGEGYSLSQVTNMAGMFKDTNSFQGDGLRFWTNTGLVTDMSYMFNSANGLSAGIRLDGFNTTNVISMQGMFMNTDIESFGRGLDWDTSNVTDMSYMFADCGSFNDDLSDWNTISVTTMESMFQNSNWNNGSEAGLFGAVQIPWNLTSLTNARAMFKGNSNFNGAFNGPNPFGLAVTDMSEMFRDATGFVGWGLESWNTGSVENMEGMFKGATQLGVDPNFPNQIVASIEGWNTALVSNMDSMFNGATSFNKDLSGWCVPLLSEPPSFDFGATAWVLPNSRPVWGTCPEPTTTTSTTTTSTTSTTTSTTTTTTIPPPNQDGLLLAYDAATVPSTIVPNSTQWTNLGSASNLNITFISETLAKDTELGGVIRNNTNTVTARGSEFDPTVSYPFPLPIFQEMPTSLSGASARTVSIWYRPQVSIELSTQPFTVVSWGADSNGRLWSIEIRPNGGIDAITGLREIQAAVNIGSGIYAPSSWVNTGLNSRWQNLTIGLQGDMRIYHNGGLVATVPSSQIGTLETAQSNTLHIGRAGLAGFPAPIPMVGRFGVIRIWNRILTPNEVSAEWNYYRGRFGI